MLVKGKKPLFQNFYFFETLTGMIITLKEFFLGKTVTISYPEEGRQYSDRFRGQHYIKATNGVENCTACMLCPTVCPSECIHIEAGERNDKEKYPKTFEIDILRCCFCGMCEEACPKDAIKLSTITEMSASYRAVYDRDFLAEQRGNK